MSCLLRTPLSSKITQWNFQIRRFPLKFKGLKNGANTGIWWYVTGKVEGKKCEKLAMPWNALIFSPIVYQQYIYCDIFPSVCHVISLILYK
jgi:hypothetical protein